MPSAGSLLLKNALLILLMACYAAPSFSQESGPRFFSADSLKITRRLAKWVCRDGDNPAWASPAYNDAGWARAHTTAIDLAADTPIRFTGIAWFRKWIRIDSSLVGVPLALGMSHSGASQIFLDGDSLTRYGVPSPRGSANYYDPQGEPFPFIFREAGVHLLAVRYADWGARAAWERWGDRWVAFQLDLNEAEYGIAVHGYFLREQMGLLMFLTVLFGTLGFIHLVLWLYYRPARSNLPFSLFSLSLATLCLSLLFITTANNPALSIWARQSTSYVTLIGVVSLSGFINTLFSRRQWRFRVMAGLGVLSAFLIWAPFETAFANVIPIVLFVLVLLETLVLTVWAIFRRIPGARIIGAGVLLFALLILIALADAIINNGIQLNLNPSDAPIAFTLTVASILAIPISMSIYLAWNFATVNKRLKAELLQVEALSEKARRAEEERQRLLQTRQEELEQEVAIRTEQLRGEKQKSDDLLLNILPAEIAEELKEKGSAKTKLYNDVTVLFTDFVDFTIASSAADPVALVQEIDDCFRAFDDIVTRHGLEKIKTIGDAYLAVAGLPAAHPDHATACVKAALEICDFILARRAQKPDSFAIRIGVHSGPVVAGIVGVKKFAYDIWGDTVNTAARMEQSGESGRVNISQSTYQLVKGEYRCAHRGRIAAKGKGEVEMYFVMGAEEN